MPPRRARSRTTTEPTMDSEAHSVNPNARGDRTMEPKEDKKWLRTLEKWFCVMQSLEERKVDLAMFSLQEDTEDWWTLKENRQGRVDWEDFKEIFNGKYFSETYTKLAKTDNSRSRWNDDQKQKCNPGTCRQKSITCYQCGKKGHYKSECQTSRVEGLLIQELLARVDTLEGNVGRTGSHERRDSSTGSVHIEERVQELDSSKKTLLEMINGMWEDFRATLDVVRSEIADVNARLELTMRAMANQVPARGAILVSRAKIAEPKPFCRARDTKALENYIFDLEQYFRATNTVTEETKVTLAMMHLSEDAKLW
ncbi:senescence-specific cysteine protease sag39 [Cucumis melo var. makuwa]|uniref:Senescence-specific cysteine protease sag39 n=1 Tax=Cucumis melo var. makuwa TaxID=1194695 RepID=A0A5A7TTC3_CUCMM|nr:senescence-specific cysteine protease sag39 [Cucumis melo var. makuwa]